MFVHCRFLVKDNTQKILTEISHHFWLKNYGEKGPRKNHFKIPRWLSELLLPIANKICPERLNWPGRLAGISEGHRGISK